MAEKEKKVDELVKKFEEITSRLDEVLKDIEWRKPDLAEEELRLQQLLNRRKRGELVDTYAQSEVVRIQREILQDRINEANVLEKQMLAVKAELDALTGRKAKRKRKRKHGKAV